ncbi:hypothetical protein BC826DRAFT_1179183 [Russula brevipes]|nr:hypothetical protein BC826DRAFT_1179183 [Russula brevipes]
MRLPVHLIAPPVLSAAIPSPLATGAGPQGIDVPNLQKAIKWLLAKSPGAAFAYIKSDRRHPYGALDTISPPFPAASTNPPVLDIRETFSQCMSWPVPRRLDLSRLGLPATQVGMTGRPERLLIWLRKKKKKQEELASAEKSEKVLPLR